MACSPLMVMVELGVPYILVTLMKYVFLSV